MRAYKETLGIIKRATSFVNFPLTGPITAGVNQAADDIARGLKLQDALRTPAQVPQQASSNFLSGIGNWMPLLFGMGGLGSLFNSNNIQAQTQPQAQNQVPVQTPAVIVPGGSVIPGTSTTKDTEFLNNSVTMKQKPVQTAKGSARWPQLQEQMQKARRMSESYGKPGSLVF